MIKSKIQSLDNTPIVDGENGYLFDDNDSGLSKKDHNAARKERGRGHNERKCRKQPIHNIKDNCQIYKPFNNLEKGELTSAVRF